MPSNEQDFYQRSINIRGLYFELIRKWYLIATILIVCMASSLFYTYLVASPLYDSTAKIYVINKDVQIVDPSEITTSSYLAKDYLDIIVDRAVLEEVSENLNNNYSYGALKSAVSVYNPDGTRFIEITARTPNAQTSKKIVDMVCKVSQEKIVELLGIDRVTIVRQGDIATNPSSPNVQLNVIKGVLIGVLLSVILIFVLYIQNDKINTPDDVKKYLNMSVLGIIPYNQNKQKSK